LGVLLLPLPPLADEVALAWPAAAEEGDVDNDEDDAEDTVTAIVGRDVDEDGEDDVREFDEDDEDDEDRIVAVGFDVDGATDEVEIDVGGGIEK
jgi:hypothetical protein